MGNKNSVVTWPPNRLWPWIIAVARDSNCLKTAALGEKSSGVPKKNFHNINSIYADGRYPSRPPSLITRVMERTKRARTHSFATSRGEHHPSTTIPEIGRSDPFIEGVHFQAHLARTSGATFKDAINDKSEIGLCEDLRSKKQAGQSVPMQTTVPRWQVPFSRWTFDRPQD